MGRPARIDPDGVVAAAIAVLDTEGPGALSLDRLAEELGVSAPSLYYHYKDKSAILDAVAYTMLADLGVSNDHADWRDLLVEFCDAFYRRVAAHPNVVALLLEHLPERSVLTAFDQNARTLTRAGVPVAAQAAILEGVQHFLWGIAMYTAVGVVNPAFSGEVDPGYYPAWAKALTAKPFADPEFVALGVRALIDGLVSHIEQLEELHTMPEASA